MSTSTFEATYNNCTKNQDIRSNQQSTPQENGIMRVYSGVNDPLQSKYVNCKFNSLIIITSIH